MAYNSSSRRSSRSESMRMICLEPRAPTRFADDCIVREYGSAAHDGSHDGAAERSAEVWADAAAGLKLFGREHPIAIGIDQSEIGVGADGDRAFARIEAEQLRRRH